MGLLEDRAVVPSIDHGDSLVDASDFEVWGDLWLISIFFSREGAHSKCHTLTIRYGSRSEQGGVETWHCLFWMRTSM